VPVVSIIGDASALALLPWETTTLFLPVPTPTRASRALPATQADTVPIVFLILSMSIRIRHRYTCAISEIYNAADYTLQFCLLPVGTIDKELPTLVRSTRARKNQSTGRLLRQTAGCPAGAQRSPGGCHGTLERILRRSCLDSVLWRAVQGSKLLVPYSIRPRLRPTSQVQSANGRRRMPILIVCHYAAVQYHGSTRQHIVNPYTQDCARVQPSDYTHENENVRSGR
jgi:hypothetical protein